MAFKDELGDYAEGIIADVLRGRGWQIENLNLANESKHEWGDLYAVSPSGVRLFLSVKGRNAIEHQSRHLILNGSYDGKGRRLFHRALNKLKEKGKEIDGVGWIAVAMNLSQTYEAYVGRLDQMIVTGMSEPTPDEWKWSIPMRPIDRRKYLHIRSGPHDFDWARYPNQWFYDHYRLWQKTGVAPVIHDGNARNRSRPFLSDVFPDITGQLYAKWDVRSTFGC